MTPQQAIAILDQATDPRNSGKLQRADYANINTALIVLSELVTKSAAAASPEAVETKSAP